MMKKNGPSLLGIFYSKCSNIYWSDVLERFNWFKWKKLGYNINIVKCIAHGKCKVLNQYPDIKTIICP